jgi:hypothetical protein
LNKNNNDCYDSDILESLLEIIEGKIEGVSADGAYDRRCLKSSFEKIN